MSEKLLTVRQLPIINERFFRFHGHGELINKTHFQNLCQIANHNPETTFALWTKRPNLVKGQIPENLILIYSNGKVDRIRKIPPKGFHKVFNNVSSENPTKAVENCTGQKCVTCMLCYNHNDTSVIIEATKLNGRTIKQ